MNLLKEENFSAIVKGKKTALFTLRNKNGMVVQLTNFGAKIASIFVADKNGTFSDVVLGYDTINGYINGHPYYGAICGRYANRIANGLFTIDGIGYQLPINNGSNHLHGGPEGFNNQVFDAESIIQLPNGQSIKMNYHSVDGEMGYPGNLSLSVNYTLTDQNELLLEYNATTDKSTHVNICSHSYFNLAGEGNGDILNHILSVKADKFTPVSEKLIPSGEYRPVEETPLDFRKATIIGERIDENYDQLAFGAGYDHNWILNKGINQNGLAATCYDPESGRTLEVFTTQPGLQVYTGNFIDEADKGKGGKLYKRRGGVCLETQHFPDSPNKPEFPSSLLCPGETYQHSCTYKFGVK